MCTIAHRSNLCRRRGGRDKETNPSYFLKEAFRLNGLADAIQKYSIDLRNAVLSSCNRAAGSIAVARMDRTDKVKTEA
jgi:hypothetical protein